MSKSREVGLIAVLLIQVITLHLIFGISILNMPYWKVFLLGGETGVIFGLGRIE